MNWEHYIYVLSGYASAHLWMWIKNSYQYKYKWECPNCHFSVKSGSPSAMRTVKMTHTH